MSDSILIHTKKIIGIDEDDDSFDLDVITHINSTFSILHQYGVGPVDGLAIEDDTDEWDDFSENTIIINLVKTYLYFRTKAAFDPPATSFAIEGLKNQIQEYETRISYQREWELDPVDPSA